MRHQVIADKLAEIYEAEVLQGKGGFWVRGHGFITLAKARKLTGVKAPARERQRMPAWGDYATIAMLNRQRPPRKTAPHSTAEAIEGSQA